jgi:hypothetical protein
MPTTAAYREHLVPCAYIRDRAFKMYQEGSTVNDVAGMVGRLLKIAFITPDEAKLIDSKYKTNMPPDWDHMKDSITSRLEGCGIKLILSEAIEPARDHDL